jgi:phospholipase C
MAYFDRSDLPFYYAMADSWSIGDQYFQSTQTATNPNRLFLFSGRNCDFDGLCHLDDDESEGLMWENMAETLQDAGVSWRVLQESDNFDDNAFEWFQSFIDAKPGSPLFEKGIRPVPDIALAFQDLVSRDALPEVTWIIAPTALSEHASNHPADGEDLTARLLKVLRDSPAVYSKTVFILNYDEGGQFYDHHWVPLPPSSPDDGSSTVSTFGELLPFPQQGVAAGTPYGLGFRVPLILVSPWTRGHLVYSEVCDHTSVIKFIEKRFNVRCPNISPWRRAIVGDLSAAFDWKNPDFSWPTLPETQGNVNASAWQCTHLPSPKLPLFQSMPVQEMGSRVLRPLPYVLSVDASADVSEKLQLVFESKGLQGAVFQVYDYTDTAHHPRKFTVGARASLNVTWPARTGAKYNLSAHGPNGFVRGFSGRQVATCMVNAASNGVTVYAATLLCLFTRPALGIIPKTTLVCQSFSAPRHPVQRSSITATVAVFITAAAEAPATCTFSLVDSTYRTHDSRAKHATHSTVAATAVCPSLMCRCIPFPFF